MTTCGEFRVKFSTQCDGDFSVRENSASRDANPNACKLRRITPKICWDRRNEVVNKSFCQRTRLNSKLQCSQPRKKIPSWGHHKQIKQLLSTMPKDKKKTLSAGNAFAKKVQSSLSAGLQRTLNSFRPFVDHCCRIYFFFVGLRKRFPRERCRERRECAPAKLVYLCNFFSLNVRCETCFFSFS